MKRIAGIVLGGMILLAMASAAVALEYSMKGEFEYRYRFFERMGEKDLYGNAKLQDKQGAMFVGMAGPSFYQIGAARSYADANAEFAAIGTDNVITRGGFSRWSSDARITDMRLTLFPTIKVNPAIEIYLALNIGGFRNKYDMWRQDPSGNYSAGVTPLERSYMSQSSDAATNTAALVSVDEFKFAFQIPWGMFSFGTKNFPLGTGATFARNTREESIYILVPYGPINVRFYLFPSEPPRVTGAGATGAGSELDNAFSALRLSGWGTGPDGEAKSRRFIGAVIQYQSGEMEVGAGLFNRKVHLPRGYSGQIRTDSLSYVDTTDTSHFPLFYLTSINNVRDQVFYQFDRETYIGLAWAKYNNGRFFANLEYAFSDSDSGVSSLLSPGEATHGGTNVGGYAAPLGTTSFFAITGLRPKFETLTYHVFGELGLFAGPAKVTLMGAQSSGNVLSNYGWLLGPGGTGGLTIEGTGPGYTNANWATSANGTRAWGIYAINYQALEPYNLLMFNTYGGGNSIFNADGTGEMGDARAIALRLDYAVAANLNLFGSFMYAKRLERHGYLAGQFGTRDGRLTTVAQNRGADGNNNPGQARLWKAVNGYQTFVVGAASPWIDDDFIGWEANAGLTWQLLEGLTFDLKYAYWRVGEWFDMAYKAYNGGYVNDPVNGVVYGADLMRGRSAIQALQMSLKVNF